MSPISIALIILAVTVILFIWEPVPIIVTAIGASTRLCLYRFDRCERHLRRL